MYQSIYHLRKAPFAMTPDPNAYYMSTTHREALVGLTHAILAEKGFALLTGDAGMGKTTMTARILQQLPKGRVKSSVVFNPTLTPQEFLEMVLMNFGVEAIPTSKAQRLALLRSLLESADQKHEIALLIVDEAHKLSAELLEEIRLLGNFERPDKKLLQIVLVGQSELGDMLDRPELWQFKQRFATRVHIARLLPAEVADYVRSRWNGAGGVEVHPFSASALAVIAEASNGIPRVINGLCENSLLVALAEGELAVTETHVLQVCADLKVDLPRQVAPAAVAEPVIIPEPVLAWPDESKPVEAPRKSEAIYEVAKASEVPALASLESYSQRPSLFRRFAVRLRLAS